MPQILFAIFILLSFIFSSPLEAKKIGYRFPAKETKEERKGVAVAGSFRVEVSDDSECEYSKEQFAFSGFDKKLNSSQESFFLTNKSNRILTGIELFIEYLTPDGRQLDMRFHEIKCNIPAGETRKIDIKSWDSQHSFHYIKSAPAKGGGTPFIVRFFPQAFYLRY